MVSLIQLWHIHQPITQSIDYVNIAVEKAYRKLIDIYISHPGVKWSLNISGALLERIVVSHQELIKKIQAMVDSGQLEIVTTAYYQPIITVIPPAHAIKQIKTNTSLLYSLFSVRPRVMWLPERVWEPYLPPILNKAGVETTLVDEHIVVRGGEERTEFHRKSVLPDDCGEDGKQKYYAWKSSHNKGNVNMLSIDKRMRYLVPWEPVANVMNYIESVENLKKNGREVIVFGDDGEKMGEWPNTEGTHQWLDDWLKRIEENDWIESISIGDYLRKYGVRGEGKFPSGTYEEMEGWCFGDFKNWLSHPQVKPMYHRLMEACKRIKKIDKYILMAESNDPYWYTRSMTYHRQNIYKNILLSEAGGIKKYKPIEIRNENIWLEDERQIIILDSSGRISEWDLKELNHNIVNTGFFNYILEEKQFMKKEHLNEKRRGCLTDFIDNQSCFEPAGKKINRRGVKFDYKFDGKSLSKSLRLSRGNLWVEYESNNSFSFELCFTPVTTTPESSIMPWHKVYFGPPLSYTLPHEKKTVSGEWICIVDEKANCVIGAKLPQSMKMDVYIAGEGIAIRVYVFESKNISLPIYAYYGGFNRIKG